MDLGIAGRKAIVCASSRGLGRACAHGLAEAGVEVVINGLDAAAGGHRDRAAQGDRRQVIAVQPTSRRRKARTRCSPPARSPTS